MENEIKNFSKLTFRGKKILPSIIKKIDQFSAAKYFSTCALVNFAVAKIFFECHDYQNLINISIDYYPHVFSSTDFCNFLQEKKMYICLNIELENVIFWGTIETAKILAQNCYNLFSALKYFYKYSETEIYRVFLKSYLDSLIVPSFPGFPKNKISDLIENFSAETIEWIINYLTPPKSRQQKSALEVVKKRMAL